MKFMFNGNKSILLTAHRLPDCPSKTLRGLIKFSINLSLKKCGVVSHYSPFILEKHVTDRRFYFAFPLFSFTPLVYVDY